MNFNQSRFNTFLLLMIATKLNEHHNGELGTLDMILIAIAIIILFLAFERDET